MLNENIKIDLHIHTFASKYKESNEIVDKSISANLKTLFNSLNDNEISMFSFTDHNRFDPQIYKDAKSIILSNEFPKVKNILPGVEFDVKLDASMAVCHILTYFNCCSDNDFEKIDLSIKNNLLISKDSYYSKVEFENLLKSIGLSVILIVCQRKSLNNQNGKHTSLSDSTPNPYQVIQTGYINALEFQKTHVEGILKKNLRDENLNTALITGSDCHDWDVYPFHDKVYKTKEADEKGKKSSDFDFYSIIKALPTFKGLLLALTSNETRFNRISNANPKYVDYVEINGVKYNLSPGINAIIGENGSGKTTLLNFISNQTESYSKKIIDINEVKIDKTAEGEHVEYIKQSRLVDDYKKSKIFDDTKFKSINHQMYEKKYTSFIESLWNFINGNISLRESYNDLENKKCTIIPENEKFQSYYISIICDESFIDIEKKDNRYENLKTILADLRTEIKENKYYEKHLLELRKAYNIILGVFKDISREKIENESNKIVKNTIVSARNDYEVNINKEKTSKEKAVGEYIKTKSNVIDAVLNYIKNINNKLSVMEFPKDIKGTTINPSNGFNFTQVANYNEKSLEKEFYKSVFNSEYSSFEKVKGIDTLERLKEAVKQGSRQGAQMAYNNKCTEFLNFCKETTKYIKDISDSTNVGSTLGEMSLSFYKYITNNGDRTLILLIDQPEDNISNSKVKNELIKYFNNIRDKKQIIIVTHNPLLVVNLDVDNVIYLSRDNANKFTCFSGCLEDDSSNILNLVAENMDGGKETIERRLKFYGENN